MLFVQQNTSVAFPRLYALYTDTSDQKTYIIMERITGDRLDSLWPQMSEVEKTVVSRRLRESIHQLRSLPAPGGRYGSLSDRGLMDWHDWVFWTGNSMDTLAIEGPFNTEDELNSAMIKKYLFNCGLSQKAKFYERALSRIFRDHPPVFTHGDFQRKNLSHEAQPLGDRELGAW